MYVCMSSWQRHGATTTTRPRERPLVRRSGPPERPLSINAGLRAGLFKSKAAEKRHTDTETPRHREAVELRACGLSMCFLTHIAKRSSCADAKGCLRLHSERRVLERPAGLPHGGQHDRPVEATRLTRCGTRHRAEHKLLVFRSRSSSLSQND